jgi:multiple sugar transport system substrate-binding protein
MRKIISLFLVISLSATMVFASGSSEKETTKTSSKDETVSVMIWDSNQEAGIKEILSDFTAETGIKTDIQIVSWNEYWTLLEASAKSDDLPDVFWMHANSALKYMQNGLLMDVTDKIAQSDKIDINDYYEDITELYSLGGKNYALPKDIDTIALWYNKTYFDEAGLAYPTDDWTWDDLIENAKKLTKSDGSVYGFTLKNDNGQGGWFNMINDANGYVISDDKKSSGLDDPKTLKGMESVQKLLDAKVMPSQEIMSETEADVLLGSGKVAMATFGSWMLSAFKQNEYISQNCDVARLPKDATTGRQSSVYNGLGWAISATTPREDSAWKVVEYLSTKEAQIKQANLGVTMSAYKGTSDGWVNSAPNFNLQAYIDMQDDMVMFPNSKSGVKWNNAIYDCMKEAWMGQITVEQACIKGANEMNAIIAEE